jgi:hypothetical protein
LGNRLATFERDLIRRVHNRKLGIYAPPEAVRLNIPQSTPRDLSPHAVLAGDRKGRSSAINRVSNKGRRFGGPDQKVPRAVCGAQTTSFAPYTRPDQPERASEPREAEPKPRKRYIGAADNPRG